ncbi:MAG: hypothetical protein COW30_14745 [Rhodospirillales bacterium CG15_BIG_FIL_POST_REV_8_21_14_020_66_15]|nr:MAG: hypothetical protein COW30_14745 [Rhodospirillales bacterium CG15_BIG_FIL_POST_REV_8_21_14_020_66_15]
MEITAKEARTVYNCLQPELIQAYAKAGHKPVVGYHKWPNVATAPYQAATHGNRYVNNFVDPKNAKQYQKYEKAGKFPAGAVLAKDSFVVAPDGKVSVGPLFIMEKQKAGWNKNTHDWKYVMVMPNGAIGGATGSGKGIDMQFCADCHNSVYPGQDAVMLLPEEYRKK